MEEYICFINVNEIEIPLSKKYKEYEIDEEDIDVFDYMEAENYFRLFE